MTKGQYELKKFMKLRLKEMQAKNPMFSLRAFAKSLGIHAASLSEFFNDKRQFSPKQQEKIIRALNLPPDKKEMLLAMVKSGATELASSERVQMDADSYYLVADPIYYSLLCLIETKGFKEDTPWIARRLQKTEQEIDEALERLLRLGHVKRVGDELIVGEVHLSTTDDVANTSLRLRHSENLDNAKVALLNLSVEERYFQFETLAINMDQMPAFKKAAQQFLDRLHDLSKASQDKHEVYEFTLGFFPRTVKELACSSMDGTDTGTSRSKNIDPNNSLH